MSNPICNYCSRNLYAAAEGTPADGGHSSGDPLLELLYWLSNTVRLFSHLTSDHFRSRWVAPQATDDVTESVQMLITGLGETITFVFQQAVYGITKVLYAPVVEMLLPDSDPSSSAHADSARAMKSAMERVLHVLRVTLDVSEDVSLHRDVTIQLVMYLVFFVTTTLFNKLITKGAECRLLCWPMGVRLQWCVSCLENWVSSVGLEAQYLRVSEPLVSLVDLLATSPHSLHTMDWSTLRGQFRALSEAQLTRVVSHYCCTDGRSPPPSWRPPPDLNLPEGVTVSLSSHPPFVLPQHGVWLDLRGPLRPPLHTHLQALVTRFSHTADTGRGRGGILHHRFPQDDPHELPSHRTQAANLDRKALIVEDVACRGLRVFSRASAVSFPGCRVFRGIKQGWVILRVFCPSSHKHPPPQEQRPKEPQPQDFRLPLENPKPRDPRRRPLDGTILTPGTLTLQYKRIINRVPLLEIPSETTSLLSESAVSDDVFAHSSADVCRSSGSGSSVQASEFRRFSTGMVSQAVGKIEAEGTPRVVRVEMSEDLDEDHVMLEQYPDDVYIDVGEAVAPRVQYRHTMPQERDLSTKGEITGEVFTLTILKEGARLGMGLVDGMHTPLKLPGIYVRNVMAGTPAALCGHIRVGDRILAVNGRSIVGSDYNSAMKLIRSGGPRLNLLVAKCDRSVTARISAS
ncbi:ras-associating and dilute domain-containing protein-like [Babylonia areolata]|uniref:ras-associating and dilute domain-containing protein-like n=1 Tax=Babylonia areolata TaxID=304850 RepID=UPI003FD3D552